MTAATEQSPDLAVTPPAPPSRPPGWTEIALKRGVAVAKAKVLADESEHRYLGLEHIESWTGRLSAAATASEVQGLAQPFDAGDVLFGKLRPYLAKVHLASVPGVCTSEALVLRPRLLDGQFLAYCMRRPEFIDAVNGMTYGAKMPRASWDDIGGMTVLVPPRDTQRRIAAFLDRETARIDALIEKKQRLVELLKEKRQAVITQAVTRGLDPTVPMKDSGVEWLGEVPAHWRMSRLKFEVADVADCLHSTPTYADDGVYPAIRTADISPGVLNVAGARRISEAEYLARIVRLRPEPGDIIYSREGERFGMAADVPDGATVCLGQRVMMFRTSNRAVGRFLMWQLNSNWVYWQADQDVIGATSPHVNVETIENFIIAMPPLDEQARIAREIDILLGNVDRLSARTQRSIELLQEHRSALITSAVTGQIDVRDAA